MIVKRAASHWIHSLQCNIVTLPLMLGNGRGSILEQQVERQMHSNETLTLPLTLDAPLHAPIEAWCVYTLKENCLIWELSSIYWIIWILLTRRADKTKNAKPSITWCDRACDLRWMASHIPYHQFCLFIDPLTHPPWISVCILNLEIRVVERFQQKNYNFITCNLFHLLQYFCCSGHYFNELTQRWRQLIDWLANSFTILFNLVNK